MKQLANLTERGMGMIEVFLAARRKRATVYARHSVMIEDYRVDYIDNNVVLPMRVEV